MKPNKLEFVGEVQNAKCKAQSVGTALRLYCLPLTREVAKSLILTEGEIDIMSLDYPSVNFVDSSPDKGSQNTTMNILDKL